MEDDEACGRFLPGKRPLLPSLWQRRGRVDSDLFIFSTGRTHMDATFKRITVCTRVPLIAQQGCVIV
jgi:hypothetical protein